MFLISNRSAPATNPRDFAEAKITATGLSCSSFTTARFKSCSIAGLNVLTLLPARSSQTVAILSASVVIRTLSIASTPFQQNRRPLPAAHAQRGDSVLHVATTHLHQQRQDDSSAGRTNGMPECDRPAVDVEFFGIDLTDSIG